MQPVLTQVPPNSLRSTSATFIPADVSRPASDGPACPAPITMASKISVMVLAHDECCVGDCTGVLQRGGKRSDTVGEFAGLAESSTYAGKSARIVASIRTETGSLSFLAQP